MVKAAFVFMSMLLFAAMPARAATITYDFSVGATGQYTSASYSGGGGSFAILTPLLYRVAPTALNSTTQFVSGDAGGNPAYLVRQAGGISITTALETTADEVNQIDSQGGTNELLKMAMVGGREIVSAVFNYVDSDDSLRIYGSNGSSTVLNYLGFGGTFYTTPGATHSLGSGTAGATATTTNPTGTLDDSKSFTVIFSKLPIYDYYYFTSNNDTGDGYRLKSLTVTAPGAVPETSTWAMMMMGFGAIGVAIRMRGKRRLFFG